MTRSFLAILEFINICIKNLFLVYLLQVKYINHLGEIIESSSKLNMDISRTKENRNQHHKQRLRYKEMLKTGKRLNG